jgi:thioredoxin-related protein
MSAFRIFLQELSSPIAMLVALLSMTALLSVFFWIGLRVAKQSQPSLAKLMLAALASTILTSGILVLASRSSETALLVGAALSIIATIGVIKGVFDIALDKAYIVWVFAIVAQVLALLMVGVGVGAFQAAHRAVLERKANDSLTDKLPVFDQEIQGSIVWMNYAEGMEKAAAEGKYVLVDFWTSWCHWCKVMDKDTYGDETVQARLLESFVIIKVDAESKAAQGGIEALSGVDLARQFQVSSFPTTWFTDASGKKIAPLAGFSPPEQFLVVLDFIATGAYENQNFQEFQASHN